MNTKGKKTIKIIVNILLWIFLVFALAMTIFAFIANSSGKKYPVVGDKAWFCVQTDSMEGSSKDYASGGKLEGKKGFKVGDLIIGEVLTDKTKKELKVGDVITFNCIINGKDELNSHRIIKINNNNTVTTQGDKYTSDETKIEVVALSEIEAKWTGKRVAGLGSFIDFFRSSVGFLCCIVIPLALFFIYEIIVLVLTVKKMKGKKAPALSKEDEEEIKKRAIEEYLAKQALENSNVSQEDVEKVSTPKTSAKKTTPNKTEKIAEEKKAPSKKVASNSTAKKTTATSSKKASQTSVKKATASATKKAPVNKVASKTTTKKTTKTTNKK